ncbi:MAG: folylpolyglutamate synthase/dihydrofolate synthase family protein [bacterium]
MNRLEQFLAQSRGEYAGMRLGLHRMQALLERLGHPEKSYATVLIAGTNGKGSTARMVESVLRKAEYRTGLYTSPHLVHFHERIEMSGTEVSDAQLEAILSDWADEGILDAEGKIPVAEGEWLTWFEKATLLAFEAFRRAGVQIVVLEVGLGGRLDATNAAEPLVSAITSIGYDHTEVLGETLEKIAAEKAGVLRRDRPLVLGEMPQEIREGLRRRALAGGAFPVLAGYPEGTAASFSYEGFSGLFLPLAGEHQLRNAAVAIEVLWALAVRGFPWSEEELRGGLAEVRHPGRLERVGGLPPVLMDGAHNPEALTALVAYLRGQHPRARLAIVLGMSREKDHVEALRLLHPLGPSFFFTEFPNSRSLGLEDWRGLAKSAGISGEFFSDPKEALAAARRSRPEPDLIVVTGSLFLVGSLRALENRGE